MPDEQRLADERVVPCSTSATEPSVDQEVARLRDEVTGLLKAVETRDVIGQAKGILMERHKLSAAEAFDWLREASQHTNVKVADLAVLLAETGEWPPAGGRQA